MSDISLSKAVRSNLLSLQNTAEMMGKTQERLSTGNKVNSALDNPTNFFTAASLNSRAGDLNSLMDSMANGIQTLEAADNGLTSITKTLESMQSTLRQARQDKTFLTNSYTMPAGAVTAASELSFSGGAIGTTPVDVELTKGTAGAGSITWAAAGRLVDDTTDTIAFTTTVDGVAQNITINRADVMAQGNGDDSIDSAQEFANLLSSKVTGATFSVAGNVITGTSSTLGTTSRVAFSAAVVTDADSDAGTVTNTNLGMTGTIAGTAGAADGGVAKTIDELVSEINSTTSPLKDMVRASNDNGKLRIENLSTQELKIDGVSSSGAIDGSSTGVGKIAGNTVRADLALQFNELRDQLDKLSDDASFNGINLLRGDNLKITFNETGTSEIDIQTKDNEALNAANLNIFDISAIDLDSDTNIDAQLANLKTALSDVRSQSSAFGSNLSIVQNRQDFTKEMINTLETGGANLTLADMNEEAANLLALQTRQSLSSSSLSLASQADQSVLQLLQ